MGKSISGEGESETLTFRLPKKLKAEVTRAAAAGDRSLTHYIIHALKGQLAQDKRRAADG